MLIQLNKDRWEKIRGELLDTGKLKAPDLKYLQIFAFPSLHSPEPLRTGTGE